MEATGIKDSVPDMCPISIKIWWWQAVVCSFVYKYVAKGWSIKRPVHSPSHLTQADFAVNLWGTSQVFKVCAGKHQLDKVFYKTYLSSSEEVVKWHGQMQLSLHQSNYVLKPCCS